MLFVIFYNFTLVAQDTIKVMTYNLLNYNIYTSYCTTSNNNVNSKDLYLRDIFTYVMPDILGVNELGAGTVSAQRLLDSVINRNGINWYHRANYVNSNSSTIVSTIFYDSRKVTLYEQNYLPTNVRDIMIYKFYYNSPDLATLLDTVFLTCIQMHLKAGSNDSDQSERAAETLLLMNYLNGLSSMGNTLVMGDFNVQTSTETCFQNLINYTNANVRFYDPVNKLGYWHSNTDFTMYHSQSTNLVSNNCNVSSGLDDRFDFILESFYIMHNIEKVSYVSGSYTVIGQDGNHLNQSLISPANYSVPANVLNALFYNSDHLPVTVKLKINQTPFGINKLTSKLQYIKLINPVNENAEIEIYSKSEDNYNIYIFNQLGEILSQHSFHVFSGYNYIILPMNNFTTGFYYINFTGNKNATTIKVLKN